MISARMMHLRLLSLTILLSSLSVQAKDTPEEFGVDCSFPIHRKEFKCDFMGDKKKFYEDFMQGCRDYYGQKGWVCDRTEDERIHMSLLQPQSMVNYTSTGFKKIRAPKELYDLLKNHWDLNKNAKEKEVWSTGNIYVNHWEAPTYLVNVESKNLKGSGFALKQKIWDAAKPVVEEWTGMELQPISQYGIRIYTDGAVLSPHADRLPLVSSCIVNVAQDVDEDWPLEVVDRNGHMVNVTMEPGDMVLYESGSLIHARPYPLKGRYFANIFIHFEPTGRPLNDVDNSYLDTLDDFLPPYLIPDTPWVDEWTRRNPNGWKKPAPSAPKLHSNALEAHVAAAAGEADRLEEIAKTRSAMLNKQDENGWLPLHEAVRAGNTRAAQVLIKYGADVNALTKFGQSPLNLALERHSPNSPMVRYLRRIGAEDIGGAEEEL